MTPMVFNFFGCSQFNDSVFKMLGYELGIYENHEFPDGEVLVKMNSSVKEREITFAADLFDPNAKILPLIMAVETARECGATKVHLVTPYLPYMRQDKQFHPNEGVTAHYFAKLLSPYFDSLITIEPHLHRIKSLAEIYSMQAVSLKAHEPIASWVLNNIEKPLLIGPDRESEQWVANIAKLINAPHVIFDKIRHGDRQVEINAPSLGSFAGFDPVIIDDVISTGQTMMKIMDYLQQNNFKHITCLGVHPLFAENAYEKLQKQGARNVVTCNTRQHPSNQIDMSVLLMTSLKEIYKR